jgi:hypothetical protein
MISASVISIIGEVTSRANADIIADLQVYDPNIVAINYQYGKYEEIVNTLTEWTKTKNGDKAKYPLLWLELPFTVSNRTDTTVSTDLRIIIARRNSDPKLKAAERMTNNFNPVLIPVYDAFMNQLGLHRAVSSNGYFEAAETLWPFWDAGQNKNPFNDKVDIIELRINNLYFKTKQC